MLGIYASVLLILLINSYLFPNYSWVLYSGLATMGMACLSMALTIPRVEDGIRIWMWTAQGISLVALVGLMLLSEMLNSNFIILIASSLFVINLASTVIAILRRSPEMSTHINQRGGR